MKRFAFLAIVAMLVGCGPAADDDAQDDAAENQPAESAHDHSHDHGELGPHGGHLVHLDPAGVDAEWTHDDESHLITVYLDGFDAEKIQSAMFVAKIGDNDEEFALEAAGEGWAITSEALMTHLNMGEAVPVSLVVVDESGKQSALIENHEHHHH